MAHEHLSRLRAERDREAPPTIEISKTMNRGEISPRKQAMLAAAIRYTHFLRDAEERGYIDVNRRS